MFKRLIAAVLSTTICTSAVVSSSTFPVGRASCPDKNEPQATADYGFQASNSLARYIADQAKESNAHMPTVTETTSTIFEITNIDFDDQTGAFCVSSSQ